MTKVGKAPCRRVPRAALLSMIAFAFGVSASPAAPETWVFEAGGLRKTALVVGTEARGSRPASAWPFVDEEVTVVCAAGGLAAALGTADALALNGYTSSWRGEGAFRSSGGRVTKIVGISSTKEAQSAGVVRDDASTEAINRVTGDLLSRAKKTECFR